MEHRTYDEGSHIGYSYLILEGKDIDKGNFWHVTKMPCTTLNIAPWYILKSLKLDDDVAQYVESLWKKFDLDPYRWFNISLFLSRLVTVVLSMLIPLYVYRWSKKLYGLVPGLICFFITCFEPNMIAHSRLVTSDVYLAGSTLMASYYFWKYSRKRRLGYLSLSALALGLAQLTKYISLLLYPIFTTIALIRYIRKMSSCRIRDAVKKFFIRDLKIFLGACAIFAVIFTICINAGFCGYRTNTPWGAYVFVSDQFKELQSRTRALAFVPVPLPTPFLYGIDRNMGAEKYGLGTGNLYFFGKLRPRHQAMRFPGYFLWVSVYKVPIAILILFLTSLYLYVRRWRQFDLFNNEIFLFAPIIAFGCYYNYVVVADIGIRYLMQVFPCALVLCGIALKGWRLFARPLKATIVALCVYELVSVISYAPHYIPYCNEFVMPRIDAYKLFADSNLDWGQGELYVDKYMRTHPGTVYNPAEPRGGTVIMSINSYVGVFHTDIYGWLIRNCKPVGHIGYSNLIFNVDRTALERSREYYGE